MTDKHCPVCGLKFTETSRGIIVGDELYHDKCITELTCTNCGVVIGYLTGNAKIEWKNSKLICSRCAKKSNAVNQ
jgi:hypothetical protein